jgi:hypothetical protein
MHVYFATISSNNCKIYNLKAQNMVYLQNLLGENLRELLLENVSLAELPFEVFSPQRVPVKSN